MKMEELFGGFTPDAFHEEDRKLITAMFTEMTKWVSSLEDKIKVQEARIQYLESVSLPEQNI
jgi:hypothetical protein